MSETMELATARRSDNKGMTTLAAGACDGMPGMGHALKEMLKTFVHWYTGGGMDELEFTEAEKNLTAAVLHEGDGRADVEYAEIIILRRVAHPVV